VLRVKLPHVTDWNNRRRQHAANYDRLLSEAGLSSQGENSPVRPLSISANAHHVFHQYVIRAQRRDDLRRFLSERGIGTEIYYPLPLHLQTCFAYLGFQPGDLPESERAAREVLAIPMFPELTEAEQDWVVDSIGSFYS
jgi:dTDP-4-amino-4,6-dideoxygalactose transaminase